MDRLAGEAGAAHSRDDRTSILWPRMIRLNAPAPDVALDGVVDGQVRRYRLSDFSGRWVVLFFYPADFASVCPTAIPGGDRRRTGRYGTT